MAWREKEREREIPVSAGGVVYVLHCCVKTEENESESVLCATRVLGGNQGLFFLG